MKDKRSKYLFLVFVFIFIVFVMVTPVKDKIYSSLKINNFFGSNDVSPEVYDIVLFWGQSNSVGYSNTNGEMPDNFDRENIKSIYDFSSKTNIDPDILENTYSTSSVKTPIVPGSAYIYMALSDSFKKITSETNKLGDGFDENADNGSVQGLSYTDGNLKNYPENFNNYISIQTSESVNMIPEFCRTYYEATGHGVIVVNGGVGGVYIQDFLPDDNEIHNGPYYNYGYLYKAMVQNFKNALDKAKREGLNIGDSYWVSFQGENNVGDNCNDDHKGKYEEYYQTIVDALEKDLKVNDDDLVEGALVETSNEIGDPGNKWAVGVQQLHNSQENIIKNNTNVVLGSSFAYDHYVPSESFYNGGVNNYKTWGLGDFQFTNVNKYKTPNKIDFIYSDAFYRASLVTCHSLGNTIHFNSASLSQIGRDVANSIIDNYISTEYDDLDDDFISINNYQYNYVPQSSSESILARHSYFNNLNFPGDVADPCIISEEYDGVLWYYVFGTDNAVYRTKDFKVWKKLNGYINNYYNGKSRYVWAPEVHHINGKYYLFITLVYWGNGYPFGNTSEGSIYVATIDSLNDLTKGIKFSNMYEVQTDIEKLGLYSNVGSSNEFLNKNHIDGHLFVEDGKYYFYFKADEGQEIYGVELKLDSNGKFKKANTNLPIKLFNRDSSENINEGPFIIKNNGKYYMVYSLGSYDHYSYRLRYAVSNNPLGPFTKVREESNNNIVDLLYGDMPYKINYKGKLTNYYDSSKNIYGPGHHSFVEINGKNYVLYHSAKFVNYDSMVSNSSNLVYNQQYKEWMNKFISRKLNLDEIGFTSDGVMYVNGPNTDNQPLPSGTTYNDKTYYGLSKDKYEIISNNKNTNVLNDGVKSFTKNLIYDTINLSYLEFNLDKRMDVSDIWLFGDNTLDGLERASAKIIVNDKLKYSVNSISNSNSFKLQLPDVDEKVKNIKIYFDRYVNLSEVEIMTTSLNEYDDSYEIKYNLDGGVVDNNPTTYQIDSSYTLNNPTRDGYSFIGWTGTDLNELTMNVNIPVGSTGNREYTANWGPLDIKYSIVHMQEQLDGTYLEIDTENLVGKDGDEITPDTKNYIGFIAPDKQTITVSSDGTNVVNYKYKRKTYNLTITKGEGIESVYGEGTYKYQEKVKVKATLLSGYKFNGWYNSSTKLSDDLEYNLEIPSSDLVLTVGAISNSIDYGNLNIISDKLVVSNIKSGTKVSQVVEEVNADNVVISTKKGTIKDSDSKLATGDILKVTSGNNVIEYKISVIGDVTGDGNVNVADVAKLYLHIRKHRLMTEECEKSSGDLVQNGNLLINDVAKLYNQIRNS